MLERSSAKYAMVLYAVDLLLTTLALVVARWLRIVLPYGLPLDIAGSTIHWPMLVIVFVIWSVTLGALGVYDPRRFAHWVDELQTVVLAIVLATLVLAGALYFSYRGLSRLLYIYFLALDVCFCCLARAALRHWRAARRGIQPHRVLIIGAGRVGAQVAFALKRCEWMGIELLGYLDDDPAAAAALHPRLGRVLGRLDQASEVIRRHGVHEVVIAMPLEDHHRLTSLVATLQKLPVNIKVVPDYSEIVFFRSTLEQFGGVLFIGLKEPVIGPTDRVIKRTFDLVVSVVGLILLSPWLAIIALWVRFGSPGPVLYHGLRLGEGGRTFRMHKFRTMVQDADHTEDDLVSATTDGELLFEKRDDDPRVTPVGAFLRRYSLDELPQLANVLMGEMSLVGPRPELPSLVSRYQPWQRKRFGVPQGITGWWQINGRGNKAKYLHVEDDLYYIRNYSLLLDLHILWRTLGAVIKGEGAF